MRLVGDRDRNALGKGVVVGRIGAGDALVDHRALTLRKLGDHRRDHIAGDGDEIVAGAADHRRHTAERRAEHGDCVIAALAVDRQALRVLPAQRQAGAANGGWRDDDGVIRARPIGAQHAQRIGAAGAVERQRRLDHVRIACRGLAEAAHGEAVVAEATVERKRRLAVQHRETVGPGSGIDGGGVADAPAQGAGCCLHRDDRIAGLHDGRCERACSVELAELEAVAAGTAVDRGDGAVVVDIERIIAGAARHLQEVDCAVVVDPLVAAGIGAGAALQHRDKICAHEIADTGRRPRDAERVRPIGRGTAVMDGGDRIARTGWRDPIGIGTRPAIGGDRVAQRRGFQPGDDAGRTGGAGDVFMGDIDAVDGADGDGVIAGAAPQVHLARDNRRHAQGWHRAQGDQIIPGRAVDVAPLGRERPVEQDLVGQRPAVDGDRACRRGACGGGSEAGGVGAGRPGIGAEDAAAARDDDGVGPIARGQADHGG